MRNSDWKGNMVIKKFWDEFLALGTFSTTKDRLLRQPGRHTSAAVPSISNTGPEQVSNPTRCTGWVKALKSVRQFKVVIEKELLD